MPLLVIFLYQNLIKKSQSNFKEFDSKKHEATVN